MNPVTSPGALLHEYFAKNGKKGGSSTSNAKVKAVRENLAKARAKRWKKRRRARAK